ncbi:MAG: M36 family metallopeptidase [Blastocatellia bacterium]
MARVLLTLCFGTALLIVVVSSGAQEIKTPVKSEREFLQDKPDAKGKTKIFPNLDIRLNSRIDLDKVINSNARAGGLRSTEIVNAAKENAANVIEAFSELQSEVPDAEITPSPLTGSVEIVRSPGALTEAAPGRSGIDIVREFIQANKKLYGLSDGDIGDLKFIGESVSRASGIRMVRVEQNLNGLPIFQSETRFVLDREGRIIRSLGSMIPKASAPDDVLKRLMSAEEALIATAASMEIELGAAQISVVNTDETNRTTELKADSVEITDKVTSKVVYFPVAPGVLIPAWSQIIFAKEADWYILTDAQNGIILWRKNIRNSVSTHQARFSVYVQADGSTPADSPAPQSPSAAVPGGGTQFGEIARTTVSMLTVQDIIASPNGWIDDCPGGVCTANETQTLGNNTLTCLDRAGVANVCDTDAGSVLDGNGRPTGNPDASLRNRDFLGLAPRNFETNYLPPPQGGAGGAETGQTATGAGLNGTLAIDQFRRGAVTQLFYTTNWYHDRLHFFGFDAASGNFQNNNFGGGGVGNDRVLGDAQDASGTDNANFATPPDGTSGRMQMFRFTGQTVDRDGGLDAEIVVHELTHGLSNRLVGNAAGLQWDIGAGMGEGWSDFYALSLLNNTNADTPGGNYATGAYATYKLGGLLDNYVYAIRRFPYTTNNTVNPLTWADVDQTTYNHSGGIAVSPLGFEFAGALEVHNSGEIWALSLWEVRSRIIADPAGANGDVPTGNQTMLAIVTDALKLTPANPTFIQARDALIDADCAANACANERWI